MSALTRCLTRKAAAIGRGGTRLERPSRGCAWICWSACADQPAKLVESPAWGKSGIVRAIAATFSSIGLMRSHLNRSIPARDAGRRPPPKTWLCALPNSGETRKADR